MQKRKICILTATRAEWGLLYHLAKEIQADRDLELQLVVMGMHLSGEFGYTYKEIEREFAIAKKIEMLLGSDSPVGVSKSMALAQISLCEAYNELNPDIIVILGDRYEMLAAASVAMVACIPIAHLHGGEATFGLIDEAVRHSITKMSHLHFTTTQEYKNRVIQLGENPNRVFNVGGFNLDSIQNLPKLSQQELEKSLNFTFCKKNFLVTFHPVTLENATAESQFSTLLEALETYMGTEELGIIFTKANADTYGRVVNTLIDSFVAKHSKRCVAFTSMGQLRYLNAMRYVDAVVGNSSSGLYDAPALKVATINIGDRQKGRIKASSIIDTPPSKEGILRAINKVFTRDFKETVKETISPYGSSGASFKTKEILKNYDLAGILKKHFYDLPSTGGNA